MTGHRKVQLKEFLAPGLNALLGRWTGWGAGGRDGGRCTLHVYLSLFLFNLLEGDSNPS